MPALWQALNSPELNHDGVDISEAAELTNVQGVQPAVWLPDIVFPDATSTLRGEEYLKIYPNGTLRRMQHLIMTITQSTMNYRDYPCDTQNVSIRFFSYTLSANQLIFMPYMDEDGGTLPAVNLIYPQGSSTAAFALNPIWTLKGTGYDYNDWKLSADLYTRPFGIVTFRIQRKSTGILKRMCLPILLIMLLCAFSYWGTLSDRIATTVTGLLALAALYIAIVGAIPLVGYMTRLDQYMLLMFVIVFTNTMIHMTVVRMNVAEKGTNWPLRRLAVRTLEFFGRVTMIPWIILTYIVCFWPVITIGGVVFTAVFLTLFECVLLKRYVPELHRTVLVTIEHIELKRKIIARSGKVNVSGLELRFLMYVKPLFKNGVTSHSVNRDNANLKAVEAGQSSSNNGSGSKSIDKSSGDIELETKSSESKVSEVEVSNPLSSSFNINVSNSSSSSE